MKTIIRALPAVVGAYILGELAHANQNATGAHGRVIGNETVLVALATVAACVLLTWLTRNKSQRRQRRSRSTDSYGY